MYFFFKVVIYDDTVNTSTFIITIIIVVIGSVDIYFINYYRVKVVEDNNIDLQYFELGSVDMN